MRTTLDIDDELLGAARRQAAARGITLTRIVEEALAATLATKPDRAKPFRLAWKTHRGRFIGGVNLADRDQLLDLLRGHR